MIGSDCTGTLPHLDWVITAAHCLEHLDGEIVIDNNGDIIANLSNNDIQQTLWKPVGGTRLPKDKMWTKPVWLERSSAGGDTS